LPLQVSIIANGPAPFEITRQAGIFTLSAKGSWGGGTLKVQQTPDGSNWFDVVSEGSVVSLTTDGQATFAVAAQDLRVVMSNATGPNLTAWLRA
jgi:hypothetical protein